MNTIKKICPHCENSFEVESFRTNQIHCSHSCAVLSRCPSLEERFWNNVDKIGPEECWLWNKEARVGNSGYGELRSFDKTILAHRYSYELVNGKIPKDTRILHSCDIRLCVNPSHLRAGTQADNIADMVAKGRGHKGESHYFSKLTIENVREIRSNPGISANSFAKKFGVTSGAILSVRNGRTWKRTI